MYVCLSVRMCTRGFAGQTKPLDSLEAELQVVSGERLEDAGKNPGVLD